MKEPRLKDSASAYSKVWPVGSVPDDVLLGISRQIVHRLAVGHSDITGDDFGTIFAAAVGGEHRQSPLGVADVAHSGLAWSVKTVQSAKPLDMLGKTVRLISGRNSPDYSLGISDPRKDATATGEAVLRIWNKRVNIAKERADDLRLLVMCRNMTAKQFLLFEQPCATFAPDDYTWTFNARGNLEGHDKATNTHCFTWQPHGSQFTILRRVPGSSRRFEIPKTIPTIKAERILKLAHYSDDWVNILSPSR